MNKHIGCLVMAAGNASRFAGNKLAAKLDGKSLIERALDAVPPELETAVVTQYDEVLRLAAAHGFAGLRNEHPDWGISHTISLGTRHLSHCDAILYLVSDQPLLRRGSVRAVVEKWNNNPTKIVGLGHNGKRGNPCIFPRSYYPELLALREDNGGNTVIRAHQSELLLVEAPQPELTDVDTRQALYALKAQQGEE